MVHPTAVAKARGFPMEWVVRQIDAPVMGIAHSLCEQPAVCRRSLMGLLAMAFAPGNEMVEELAFHVSPIEAPLGQPAANHEGTGMLLNHGIQTTHQKVYTLHTNVRKTSKDLQQDLQSLS